MIETVGMDNPRVFELMGTSYPSHEAYPYGLYWGGRQKNYFDSSGWGPDKDYVPAERIWYREGLTRDHFGFGEPYVDVMTGEVCVSASARVNNGPVESVAAADVYLDCASKVVADIAGDNIGYAFFVTCMSRREALRDLSRMQTVMAAVSVAACLLLVLVTFRSARQIAHMAVRARTDHLTGLLNRSGFRQAVKEAMAARPGQDVLIIMDLDNFKQINDKYGHPEGDVALQSFARQLEEFFNRSSDITARFGGDEFAVFMGRSLTVTEADGMLRRFIIK